MGGSHTSSTLGKRPASRDRGPSHCASWGGSGQWARALAWEDSSEGFQPRLKASLRRTQPHGRYNQGDFLRSDSIHARGSLGRIVLNPQTRTCYLINSQACEIGAWVRKPKHERNLSIVSQRICCEQNSNPSLWEQMLSLETRGNPRLAPPPSHRWTAGLANEGLACLAVLITQVVLLLILH